ncbi:MAG: conjugal transfer protein TraR [Nitrospirae bacterium GWC2_57_13]|nr:MAG: conjugal transfer protein TraR [Nitrospirae bacterium GWC2_57_13]OGW44132.1 MAG: conjugal transfer protein TraR [Nitrospirae bacterium GWD2_57_8]HAR44872.1 conjugal transfer protein TraR [Nitrospiraceae bacterium]HAS55571.1 conjugal transfer protein TraR [Nitrospiraceae bacterium]
MIESEIEQFRQKLLSLQAEIQALEESAKETTKPVELDQASMGRLTRMGAMQAQQMAQEGSRRRKRHLQKIDGALRRIEAGEYGRCFVCEEELDVRRLSVDPTTTRCMDCVEA